MIKKKTIKDHSIRSNLDVHVSTYTISEGGVYTHLRIPVVYSSFEKSEIAPKYVNIACYYQLLRKMTYDIVDFKLYANSLYFNPNHKYSRRWWFV